LAIQILFNLTGINAVLSVQIQVLLEPSQPFGGGHEIAPIAKGRRAKLH